MTRGPLLALALSCTLLLAGYLGSEGPGDADDLVPTSTHGGPEGWWAQAWPGLDEA
ncbi:MAG: hypothetical protein R3185_01640 [Candidatus Thermoplasmatota archaeon]|nr:hypothetical protein [Candidatus Thermoplasmatota archaeon]